jgi:hypothetical protein
MNPYSKRPIEVLKKNGHCQIFSKTKLNRSLKHTCLPPAVSKSITEEVAKHLPVNTSSQEIFKKASSLVKKNSKLAAIQYSLKRSIFELGPEGHNFESLVARYFQELNFKTKECTTVKGQFVLHEVDVIATKDKLKFFIECKFHNRLGIKNDIKIALYVKARWDDLKLGPVGKSISNYYLASNTAFSIDALIYSKGTGLRLLGVNAPENQSFLDEIKSLKLYPVTSLTKLNKILKRQIIAKKIIVAKDLLERKDLLIHLGLSEDDIWEIFEEINYLTKEMI